MFLSFQKFVLLKPRIFLSREIQTFVCCLIKQIGCFIYLKGNEPFFTSSNGLAYLNVKKSSVWQQIKIQFFKQSATKLLSINSCQVGIKPFVWAGQACTLLRTPMLRPLPSCCSGHHLFAFSRMNLKANSHQTQWSAFSAVGCINAEIGNFLYPCRNATVSHRSIRKTK